MSPWNKIDGKGQRQLSAFQTLPGDIYVELGFYLEATELRYLSLTCKQAYIFLVQERRRRYQRYVRHYSTADPKEAEWLRWFIGSRRNITSRPICWLSAYELRSKLEENLFAQRCRSFLCPEIRLKWIWRFRFINPWVSVGIDRGRDKICLFTSKPPTRSSQAAPVLMYSEPPYEKVDCKSYATVAMRATNNHLIQFYKVYFSPVYFTPLYRGKNFSIHPFENDKYDDAMEYFRATKPGPGAYQRLRPGIQVHHALRDIAGPWCIFRIRWPRHRNAVAYRVYNVDRRRWLPMAQDGTARNRTHCVVIKYNNDALIYVRSNIERESDGSIPRLNLTWWRLSFDDEMSICLHDVSIPIKNICSRPWYTMPLWRVDESRILFDVEDPTGFFVFLYRFDSTLDHHRMLPQPHDAGIIWKIRVNKQFCIRYVCLNIDRFIAFHKNTIVVYKISDGTLVHTMVHDRIGNFYNILGNMLIVKKKRNKLGTVIDLRNGTTRSVYPHYLKHWSTVMNTKVRRTNEIITVSDFSFV